MNDKPFIRIGDLVLPRESIASFDLDYIKHVHGAWPDNDGGEVIEYRAVHYVRLVTHERAPEDIGADGYIAGSAEYLYEHSTPEADAIIAWLEPQTEVVI